MIYRKLHRIFICAILCTALPVTGLDSQEVRGRGFDLGKAFKPVMEAMAKRAAEVLARKPLMDPEERSVLSTDSIVVVNITNNFVDTADVFIKAHNTLPPNVIVPEAEKKAESSEKQKAKRSLIARDDSSSFYQDLMPYIKVARDSFKLAPGESKRIEIRIDLKDEMSTGEYTAWVAAHVVVGEGKKDGFSALDKEVVTTSSDEGETVSIEVQGVPSASLPPGSQVISTTKLVYKK